MANIGEKITHRSSDQVTVSLRPDREAAMLARLADRLKSPAREQALEAVSAGNFQEARRIIES